jgi:hypothetical protein
MANPQILGIIPTEISGVPVAKIWPLAGSVKFCLVQICITAF